MKQNRVVPEKTDEILEEVWCEQFLGRISESEEYSPELQVNLPVKEVEDKLQMTTRSKSTTLDDTVSDFSESSGKSLGYKGNNVSVPKLSWINSMTQIVGLAAAWHQGKVEGHHVGTNIAGSPKANKNQFMQSSISFYEM